MKEHIKVQKLYEALECLDFDGFDNVYDSIYEGKCRFNIDEISLLCKLFTYNFEEIEPHQVRKIVKMTFLTIDEYNTVQGLEELIKGLKIIYNKGLIEDAKNIIGFSYDQFIYEYVSMFISSYSLLEINLFIELMYNDDSKEFKSKIMELIERSMEFGGDEYRVKGKVFLEAMKK